MYNKAALILLIGTLVLCSCARKESAETTPPQETAPPPAAEQAAVGGPRVAVVLKNGTRVPGTIVASTKTEMVVAGEDGIEHKIPLAQVKSVDYGEPQASKPAGQPAREPVRQAARQPDAPRMPAPVRPEEVERQQPPAKTPAEAGQLTPAAPASAAPPVAAAPPKVTTKTYELPAGSEVSVRTDEAIDSQTATEGQGYDAQVTRDAKDANGDVVIPRGSRARIVILSASKGGRIRGASDLVLDLASVTINGKQYTIDTVDVTKKGKSGVGANRRTAEYTGGGAALGAIIGAIAGGGKGAAIGAGAGAGAGALTQILTKGRSIKVPAESVLTFSLDKSLRVQMAE
jgi:hypothetical protein